MFKKIFNFVKQHKILSAIIILVIIGGGYYFYTSSKGNSTAVSYVSAAVQKGTIITSVSGSGQVSASNQVDIKPKASGDVVSVGIKAGQEVKAGTLIAQLDATDAQKTVRDAQAALQSAQLSLQKLQEPADQLSLLQAQNAIIQAQESKQNAQDNLTKSYDDGFNNVSNAFLDLPSVMTGLNSILFSNDLSPNQWNIDYYADSVKQYDNTVLKYRNDAYNAYNTANTAYQKNFADYKSASRFSDASTIENLINETYDTTKSIAEAIKDANNLIQFYQDKLTEKSIKPNAISNTHLSSLSTYTAKTNSDVLNLLSAKNTIVNDKQAITDADRSIDESTASLSKLQQGTDPLDIQSSQLSLQQKQNALADAQATLANYYVRAPFDGVIASVAVQKGDSASSGTAIATIITKQLVAEISLNEVDAVKVKTDQKTTLTFDAIDGLSITGQVASIDAIGTVSQGVVNYSAKIVFDTQDERVKPGMSVSAEIITDVGQDVLLVPNSAIKSNSNNEQYVEVLENNIPRVQTVETGLSNDTMTEIKSGLKEGDQVVTQTTTSATTKTTTNTRSNGGFGIPDMGGGAILR